MRTTRWVITVGVIMLQSDSCGEVTGLDAVRIGLAQP